MVDHSTSAAISQHTSPQSTATATIAWAGWGMGLAVPAIVLTLGKVAGLLWRRGNRLLAYLTGGTGAGLLFLSVWHCATSISLLTGSPLLLALPLDLLLPAGRA